MGNAVLKGAAYVLVHAPDMVLHNGTTQTTEMVVNPKSEYLSRLPESLRPFEKVLSYPPNRVYIGAMTPDELKEIEFPWYDKDAADASRFGKFGEIMPLDEFIGLMQAVDAFDLVKLTDDFAGSVREKLSAHPLFAAPAAETVTAAAADKAADTAAAADKAESRSVAVPDKSVSQSVSSADNGTSALLKRIKGGLTSDDIKRLIEDTHAEGLFCHGELVGCIKKAHEIDTNLSAHVMFENLAAKASAVLALRNLAAMEGVNIGDIEYVIECSEEACGDMNQRGGGNFAKSIAESAGAVNATGSDIRGFCAAPTHALLEAASLVGAGTFKSVAIVAGGSVAKLGMNGKDHVKKGIPILEDVLGGFAVLVSKDDGVSPVLNTGIVGRHTVGTGSAPQAVISSLVTAPLDRAGLRVTDVDKFSVEMQNPDITKPAGAGNVPEANYKMIAALSVMRNEIERSGIDAFIAKHGMTGFAPTQGHIPFGVPYLGFAREALTSGELNRVMIVGKGSLFLGRMTNLFDGVSIVIERNPGQAAEGAAISRNGGSMLAERTTERALCEKSSNRSIASTEYKENTASKEDSKRIRIGLTTYGSEHGPGVLFEGAALAARDDRSINIVLIGAGAPEGFRLPENVEIIETPEADMHRKMEALLDSGYIDACVSAHYNFPIGIATVGRAATPGFGREVFIATTTGSAATGRVEAMLLGALYGIAAAKACGNTDPTVGVLNLDGAVAVKSALQRLKDNGYNINFSESLRADGGAILRGNDLLAGTADVIVTDTLTGNILMKMLSSFTTGGNYESAGSGYGPGLGVPIASGSGKESDRLVLILSRASGAPVAANALKYAAALVRGDVRGMLRKELADAEIAGLSDVLVSQRKDAGTSTKVTIPDREIVDEEIPGIDIMCLDEAVNELFKEGIYAESGMGCTGPVVLVNAHSHGRAVEVLNSAGFLDL